MSLLQKLASPEGQARLKRFRAIYFKTLAALLVFLAASGGTYVAMHHDRIFPARDQIVVYGRDSCGLTSRLREELTRRDVPFVYGNIDKAFITDELWVKVSGPLGRRRVVLPIVEINGSILESPAVEEVLEARAEGQRALAKR